ncbi:DMT family transporter [Evansella halocellulosilytica]|uniref:DMT family transporter n=1 Tax=Evansella halocellulosilytica TaxID=2011013 RepID=UPI000BB6DF95|nr:DMT family transporter [Evansella halocellulosilytica]
MKAEHLFRSKWGMILAAGGATFLWGSSFPFIKLSYDMLGIEADQIGEQILFAGYRFFLAALMIIFILYMSKTRVNRSKDHIQPLMMIGFFQTFLQYILFYIGLSLSTGIQGSIIAGTTTFFQIIFAHFMYKDDHLSWRKVVGLIIGFMGVIFVNLTNGSLHLNFGLGEILLIIAMISSAFGNILARNGSAKMDVAYLTTVQMFIGSIGLLTIGVFSVGFFPFDFDISSFMILIYLSFISAAGFILWNNVMKYNKVGKVSVFLFLIPVFGVFLSSLILDEPIHLYVIVGLIFVTSGIVIVNRNKAKQA